jgi:hypothetical protein
MVIDRFDLASPWELVQERPVRDGRLKVNARPGARGSGMTTKEIGGSVLFPFALSSSKRS